MDDDSTESLPSLAGARRPAGKPSRIVAIGAGAGGLEAVQLLFGAMPVDAGLAFVICRFVEPGLADPLAELLRAQTTMPILHAEDGTVLEADHIYLLPPSARMILLNNALMSFEDNEDAEDVSPIDLLLHSLGASAGPSAIAVILSGNGEDGVRGAESVRRFGGLVLVQHPESTEYGGMPGRVIEADLASTVATPSAMPDLIWRHLGKATRQIEAKAARRAVRAETAEGRKAEPDDKALSRIMAILKARLGVDSRAYRPSMMTKRVRRRVEKSDVDSLSEYAELLTRDQTELLRLHDDLLIGVTAFFRDPEAFAVLESEVAPALVERMSEDRPIRVWVPGCATGEEAYSLAMLLLDRIEDADRSPHLEVIASDRHARALKRARLGRYRRDRLGGAPEPLVARYMEERGDHVEIGPLLRRHVTFVEHDLLQAAPPDDIDLVSCRNVIIYLTGDYRERALVACGEALRFDGFLFLGPSEQPGRMMAGLTVIDSKWRIYRKTPPPAIDDGHAKLAAARRRSPPETLLPAPSDSMPEAATETEPAARGDDVPGDLDGVLAENQRMLESTIDTLLASNDTLRRRNRDLRVENQRLVAAHAALDDVATLIAHDLKAPLRAVERHFLKLKDATVTALGRDEAARCLRPMQIQLLALDRLVDDLLAYARQGRPESDNLQSVDTAELLQETLTLIGLPRGIRVAIQPSTLQITTWRTPLACILRNLLVRAIGHIGEGPGAIRVDVRSTGQVLEIAITDDGERSGDEAKTLGLAIVRQLLDAAGGRLTLRDDHSGAGHEARFTWPVASSMALERPSEV